MKIRSQELVDVDAKLEEARVRAGNYGRLYGRYGVAEDRLKTVYAQLLQDAPANETVDGKSAWVRRHESYIQAVGEKEVAFAEWKAAEVFMKLLLAEVEVWRSKEASQRWIDNAHR
jgi:hypothetical protein